MCTYYIHAIYKRSFNIQTLVLCIFLNTVDGAGDFAQIPNVVCS